MNIWQQSFMVTGGASGLGAAVAGALARRGANVLVVDVNVEKGWATVEDLGDQAHFVAADVTEEYQVQTALDAVQERFGALHGVVNCAGIAIAERLLGKQEPHHLASFERVLRVNLVGTFNVMRLAAARMAQNKPDADGERGVIVNTASIAATDGQIGQVAYAASKAGIAGMTLPAARDLAGQGIRVMAIAPGVFDTPLLAALPDRARQSLAEQIPFPSRLGNPDEFAALALHIIENRMLNGEVIRLDGAVRMAPR